MRRLVCTSWDDATQTCTAQAWEEEPGPVLPSLTVEEAQEISVAILLVWATGFAFRAVSRALREL